MPIFRLFGADLNLGDGANAVTPNGMFNVRGTATLNIARKKLALALKGDVCGVTFDLGWSGAISLSGGIVTLAATPAPASTLTASAVFPGGAVRPFNTPILRISDEPFRGLDIVDRNGTAFDWLGKVLPGSMRVDLFMPATTVELDVRRALARYLPAKAAGPKLIWEDRFRFRPSTSSSFSAQQPLEVDAFDVGLNNYKLLARPVSGALFLHADILDTASVSDTENAFLYQYALANGRLRIGGAGPTKATDIAWESSPNSPLPPVIVLLRHQDEHGYPLALIPDTTVPLGMRDGTSGTVRYDRMPQPWDDTNLTGVIGRPSGDSQVLNIPGELRSLSVGALYAAFEDTAVAKNSLSKPWFVKNGSVPLGTDMPREIHGLSRGARLQSRSTKPIPGQTRAMLVVKPHVDGGLTRFHQTDLEFQDAGHWDILALREERDVKPGDLPLPVPGPQPIGSHRADGTPTGKFSLPAIDLPYAIANLSGVDRINSVGQRLGRGILPELTRKRLLEQEHELASVFSLPQVTIQRHVDGERAVPADRQPFARLLDHVPTAATVVQTGRLGPELLKQASAVTLLAGAVAPNTARFVFGGDEGSVSKVVGDLENHALQAQSIGDKAFRFFERAWRQLFYDADVAALRNAFGISDRDIHGDIDAPSLLEKAIAYLRSSDNIDDIVDDEDDAAALADYLSELTPLEFANEWIAPDPRLELLFIHLWSPADYDLMRRIVRSPNAAIFAQKLFDLPLLGTLQSFLDDPAGGLLQGVMQGVDALWNEAVEIYENGTDTILVELRKIYGPLLTRDVYAKLLEAGAALDAARLLDVLNLYLSQALKRLGDLAAEPPEYVLRTKRFAVAQATPDTLIDAMWQQCFDLCAFATDKLWTFFLDKDTSVLIKLSRKRSLSAILKDVVHAYAGVERPDPLGLRPYADPGKTPLTTDEIIDYFIADLDPELKEPDWTGVLLLRPVADIHKDDVLRDLAGFDHITGNYIAVGGRKPIVVGKSPGVDVWAHIFQENRDGKELPKDPGKIGDVKLALTKFDVRIRQTQLSAADIEVEIYPKDVWGKKITPPAPPPGPAPAPNPPPQIKTFPTLTLHGTLQAPAGDPSGPKDLVFSAFFPTPFTLDIDLAFVKSLELRRLGVARRNGSTGIDIDGQLKLQQPKGLDLALDLGEKDLQLDLQNFRIQVPTLPGMKVEVGARRNLAFDLPAVDFALPKPRAFNLFGVELIPTGLGYIRGNEPDALAKFSSEYLWLERLEIGNSPNTFLSYMTFSVDFGKSPNFGLVDARGLRFNMALAVKVDSNAASAAYLGISGLDAKELTIGIFGFLTLEMKELKITPAQLLKGTETPAPSKVNAGAILAKDLKLKIFNWSPTPPQSQLDLLFLHPTRSGNAPDDRRKGMLAVYDSHGKASTSFFHLYWMVLAHNMELPAKALNHLLEQNPGNEAPDGLLGDLLDKPDETPPKPRTSLVLRDVALMDRESWLFGMSFRLGALFERCSFVLHDQHYYGIRLWSKWVKAIFNQESLELAYIPGATRSEDRFRTNLRIPGLDMLGTLKSGEFAIEWGVTWDFLIDIGFPWRTSIGYDWFRSFSIPVGAYEGKFGFYIEKKTVVVHDNRTMTLAIGVAVYVGYYFGAGNSVAWVRAGIGVFAILEGRITLQAPVNGGDLAILKSSIKRIEIVGVIGVLAYGEGGVDVWILSASFRVSAQASVACTVSYVAGGPCALTYAAQLAAGYSASVEVGCGFCSWTFHVSGEVAMGVSGQLLLS